MKISFFIVSLSIILFSLFTSCKTSIDKIAKNERFSNSKPYALKISRERSFYQAMKIASRVKDLGIYSYIIQFSDTLDKTGEWFQIMCGAIENQDSAVQLKTYLSETFHIDNAEIVDFKDYGDAKLNIDTEELRELKRINSQNPDIPEHVMQLTKSFPDNNSLYINRLSIVNSPEDPKSMVGYSMIYKLSLDLPRGLSRRELLEATNCFAEVVYQDNLYGDKVTVDIGILRQKETADQEDSTNNIVMDNQDIIANQYAEQILNTGEYPTEKKEKIEVNAATKLKGYKVTISLWNKQLRTYLVLVDEKVKRLIISQSTDKSESELVEILQGIGTGDGLLNYGEFYNTFYTLPSKMPDNETFVAFSLSRLGDKYAKNKSYTRWAKEMVGHWQSTGYFRNSIKGNWSYSLFDLLTEDEQNYIYKTLYWRDQSKNKQVINVLDTKGIHVTSKKFNLKKFKTIHSTLEINFGLDRYICAIDNSEKSWLSKFDMLKRAEALQLKRDASNENSQKPVL